MVLRAFDIRNLGLAITVVWALAALAIAVAMLARQGDVIGALVEVLVATALIVVASRLHIDVGTRLNVGATWSMDAAIQLALLFVLGIWTTVLAVVIVFIAQSLRASRSMRACVENIRIGSTALASAGGVFVLCGGTFGSADLPHDYVALIAGTVVWAVVSEGLFAVSAASASDDTGLAFRNELNSLRQYLPATFLEGLLGMMVAVVFLTQPWTTLVVLPLGISLFIAMRRGVRITQVTEEALETMANIVDERDNYTFEHSRRVCDYAMLIGERLRLTDVELRSLYWTSRLHDLGKVAIDNSILNKPGRLTVEEFAVMKEHPIVSARILSSFSFNERDTDIVLCHHERFDGKGYLSRTASSVPRESFIIAVADTYDAMTSDRPYRSGMSSATALAEIRRNIGIQFDPECARAFLEVMADRGLTHEEPGDRAPVEGVTGANDVLREAA